MSLKSIGYGAFIWMFISVFYGCEPLKKNNLDEKHTVFSDSVMVVTAHPLATEVGLHILREGGNAFDAAAAVQFALTVVYPQAGNIGGGGFAVYRLANGEVGTLDFREKAPQAATINMYLDSAGNVEEGKSEMGIFSVAVPGSVKGMEAFNRKFGNMKWDDLMAPSIGLALIGFPLTKGQAKVLNKYRDDIIANNGTDNPYVREGNWNEGDTVKYPELAETLFRIGEKGSREFYRGLTAKRLVKESKKRGGIIELSDMHDYEVEWREPVEAEIDNYHVISMGAPSSGGIAIIQLLKGAAFFDIGQYPHNSVKAIHLMTELERRVFADRATFLGDPDFYNVPVNELLSDTYLRKRFEDIDMNKPTSSLRISNGEITVVESTETTHFSIVDQWGNAVSITTTLNGNFGSKVLVSGAGFFLNNEMDDFSVKPGEPNQFGLVGGKANSIQPEKRMLSSMSPAIIEKDGKLWMVVGTPGGSTIITSTYQTIQNAMWYGMTMQESVNAPKTHSQWLPDEIKLEESKMDSLVIDSLTQMGHSITYKKVLGKMSCIMMLPNGDLEGAPDYLRGENNAGGF